MLTVLIIFLIVTLCFLYRNRKVCSFYHKINHQANDVVISFLRSLKDDDEFKHRYDEYLQINHKAKMIVEKYTYEDMLFSFKPLKLEYWFTEEEIEFMNRKYKNGNDRKV